MQMLGKAFLIVAACALSFWAGRATSPPQPSRSLTAAPMTFGRDQAVAMIDESLAAGKLTPKAAQAVVEAIHSEDFWTASYADSVLIGLQRRAVDVTEIAPALLEWRSRQRPEDRELFEDAAAAFRRERAEAIAQGRQLKPKE